MDAIGYDLYCKLLNEAVKQLKGQAPEESFHTTLDLNIDAYIPESYIPNEYQKLDIYKRIANIESEEEQEDVTEELLDRFGDIPRKVQLLLDAAAIRVLAHSADVTSVEQKGDEYRIVMYERARVNPQKIQGLLDRYHGDLQFKADAIPYFIYQKKSVNRKKAAVSPLDLMKKVLTDIKALIDE
jgi:transcription-repair coupling factor (superfamily II helicase)